MDRVDREPRATPEPAQRFTIATRNPRASHRRPPAVHARLEPLRTHLSTHSPDSRRRRRASQPPPKRDTEAASHSPADRTPPAFASHTRTYNGGGSPERSALDVIAALGHDGLADLGGEVGGTGDPVHPAGLVTPQAAPEDLLQRSCHSEHQAEQASLQTPPEALDFAEAKALACWPPRALGRIYCRRVSSPRPRVTCSLEENPGGAVPSPELQHTRSEAPSCRVCRALPSNASLTGAITRLSPTTPTPPDCDALTCHYAPALD